MRLIYRSTVIELGPDASADDAREAIIREAREHGHEPALGCHAYAEQVMPGRWETVVRYHPRKGASRIVDVHPEDVTGIVMRWRHSVHEECVASHWTGYVEVVDTDACPTCQDDPAIAGCGHCRRGMPPLPVARTMG